MCGYASRFLEGRRRNVEDNVELKNQFWSDFEQFSLRLQRSLLEDEVADAAASDSRALLGCDRVSVAIRKGRSFQIRAVSGQSSVNPRANLIVAMRNLSQRVIEMGETLIYTGKVEGLAPQVEEPLAAFVQESGSRMVMLVPMFENEAMVRKQGEEEDRERRKKRPRATGCLVIEQIAESEPLPQLEQRAELLADHIGAALWNSRQYGRIFGLSLWKVMGKGLEWFRGRKLAISAAVLLGVAGLVAVMALYQLEYPIKAEGKWMPVEQTAVFATSDGLITRTGIMIPPDQLVKKGDLLIVLQNDELDGQIEEAKAAIEKQNNMQLAKENEIRTAQFQERSEESEQKGSAVATVKRLEVEKQRILGDGRVAVKQLAQLEKRKAEKLYIKAQASGRIPDFQLRQLLEDRPVRAGDHLFDIMNDGEGSQWHMELLVEEKRMGHLLKRSGTELLTANHPNLKGNLNWHHSLKKNSRAISPRSRLVRQPILNWEPCSN